MWPNGEAESGLGRASTGSEVVIMNDTAITAAGASAAHTQVNVTKSTGIHVGPKFISISQTVHNREVVKDLPLPKYLWSVIKSTTRAERLSCAAAITFLIVCVTLIIVLRPSGDQEKDTHDQNNWNISRVQWLAQPWKNEETTIPFEPLRFVLVQHSVSAECYTFQNCAAEMRILQNYFIKRLNYDIPYNFLIGNDGRVYEGRGWHIVGAHTRRFNRCGLGLGFIGDYREEIPAHSTVSKLQIQRTQMLLDYGVKNGYLHPEYKLLAAKDIQDTASPGSNLYNELRTWRHYNNGNKYRNNKTCEEMYEEFEDN